jgi:hypothetical protein
MTVAFVKILGPNNIGYAECGISLFFINVYALTWIYGEVSRTPPVVYHCYEWALLSKHYISDLPSKTLSLPVHLVV